MFPNITIKQKEEGTKITVELGRVSVELDCYQDDDGTDIIAVNEPSPGYRSRMISFHADGFPTKVFGLDQFGREKLIDEDGIAQALLLKSI